MYVVLTTTVHVMAEAELENCEGHMKYIQCYSEIWGPHDWAKNCEGHIGEHKGTRLKSWTRHGQVR